jgi:hypothetical protein
VGYLSLRIVEVSVGIGRGKIVACGGSLGVRSVGWQVSAKEKGRIICLRDPLVCVGVSSGVSRQSKMMSINHNQSQYRFEVMLGNIKVNQTP